MEILNKMEGFFDFKDFIARILKRWRLIVGVAVIFTIALGGIKYVTGISNIGTETSEENDNHSTQSEIKNIKKSIKMLNKGVTRWDEYYSNSKLMHIDSYNATYYSLVFNISMKGNPYYSDASTAASNCKQNIENGSYFESVSEKTGVSVGDLEDLVLVNVDQSSVEIRGYKYDDLDLQDAIDQLYSIVVTDMEQRYPEKYQYEKMSSTEFTGKDEILIAKQDTIIANGERYISELSSRQRVLAEMEEETPVVETTKSSVISNAVKYAVVGCVGGIVVAIILGLVLDLLNKTLSDERELKNEYGVKCLAGSNILPKKKNRIDRWIESIRCTKTPLGPEKWAEYVATRISQENVDSRSVLLTGCGVNIVEEKKLLLLKDYLKKKNINLILTNSVISDVSALTQGENVKNVILAERVGVSEVALINEEIEIIKGMDKNLVGFVLV